MSAKYDQRDVNSATNPDQFSLRESDGASMEVSDGILAPYSVRLPYSLTGLATSLPRNSLSDSLACQMINFIEEKFQAEFQNGVPKGSASQVLFFNRDGQELAVKIVGGEVVELAGVSLLQSSFDTLGTDRDILKRVQNSRIGGMANLLGEVTDKEGNLVAVVMNKLPISVEVDSVLIQNSVVHVSSSDPSKFYQVLADVDRLIERYYRAGLQLGDFKPEDLCYNTKTGELYFVDPGSFKDSDGSGYEAVQRDMKFALIQMIFQSNPGALPADLLSGELSIPMETVTVEDLDRFMLICVSAEREEVRSNGRREVLFYSSDTGLQIGLKWVSSPVGVEISDMKRMFSIREAENDLKIFRYVEENDVRKLPKLLGEIKDINGNLVAYSMTKLPVFIEREGTLVVNDLVRIGRDDPEQLERVLPKVEQLIDYFESKGLSIALANPANFVVNPETEEVLYVDVGSLFIIEDGISNPKEIVMNIIIDRLTTAVRDEN